MTRTLLVLAAFLVLAVPTAFAAPPADKGKPESPGKSAAAPGQSEDKNAAKKCKAERTRLGVEEFRKKYGTANHPNGANAFGKCVSAQKKAEAAEEAAEQAKENAAKKCAKERSELGVEAFRTKYAPLNHPNGANAFGKCVSKHAKKATTT
jgi:hypothetical protein